MTVNEIEESVEKGAMDKTEKEETSVKKENTSDESEEKSESNSKKDEKADDVVFVQDVGFTVKIVSPNLEPFDVQVSSFNICI